MPGRLDAAKPLSERTIKEMGANIATQLPETHDDALAVLAEAEWLVRNYYSGRVRARASDQKPRIVS